jgi:hypothetical protein
VADERVTRSRAELEALIERERAEWQSKVERYNYLLERKARCELELAQLRPGVERYETRTYDLDWEYFRRLQRDGVLPSLPRVTAPANSNDNEGDEDDGDDSSADFEVGEKG